MKIEGTPKEIAAFVLEVQGRREEQINVSCLTFEPSINFKKQVENVAIEHGMETLKKHLYS